jgi:hypothetical protein
VDPVARLPAHEQRTIPPERKLHRLADLRVHPDWNPGDMVGKDLLAGAGWT